MSSHDTFVWVGQPNQETDVNGNTAGGVVGGSGGHEWLATRNYWGATANWRRKVGGSTGWGGVIYYPAARTPSGGDHVILESNAFISESPISQAEGTRSRVAGDTADWPQSELLYGGVSGSGMWDGVIGSGATATNLISMEIKKSYYRNPKWATTPTGTIPLHGPYPFMRLGVSLINNPVGSYEGLNLFIDKLTSNSEPVNNAVQTGIQMVTLIGSDTKINDIFIDGVGKYFIKTDECQMVILDGEAWDPDDFEGKSLNYVHSGRVGTDVVTGLINIGCETLDQFNYFPPFGSTANNCIVGCYAKRMPSKKGAININGPFELLNCAPWENYPKGWNGGAKIAINSFQLSDPFTFDQVVIREYNPFHGVNYNADHHNSGVSFNNISEGSTDTILRLKIEAGVFETDNLNGELIINGGFLNEEGTLDLRGRKSGGSVEISGFTGGTDCHATHTCGMLNADGNSTILLPDGVNFAFREVTGGATGALFAATSIAKRSGKN